MDDTRRSFGRGAVCPRPGYLLLTHSIKSELGISITSMKVVNFVLTGSLRLPSYCFEGPGGSWGGLVYSLPIQDMSTVLKVGSSPYELDTQIA